MRMRDFTTFEQHVSGFRVRPIDVLVLFSVLSVIVGLAFRLLGSPTEPEEQKDRILYFDLWRCLCVCMVVITHCWEGYHEKNFLAANQWVLQIICLIAGTCFARTKGDVVTYSVRLLMFCGLGTLMNWTALQAIHDPLRNDVICVPFQMTFCLLFVLAAVFVSPLKWLLGDLKAGEEVMKWRHGTAALGYALCLLCLIPLAWYPGWLDEQAQRRDYHFSRVPLELLETVLMVIFVVLAHGFWRTPWIAWLHLALMQGGRIVCAEPRPGSEIHLFDVYVWASVVHFLPLAHQARIGKWMAQLWPVWAVACAFLLGLPGTDPPFPAQYPSPELLKRLRFYTVETIFLLAFTSIPSAGKEHTMCIPRAMAPTLRWLNYLSLAAFCSHKAIIDVAKHYMA